MQPLPSHNCKTDAAPLSKGPAAKSSPAGLIGNLPGRISRIVDKALSGASALFSRNEPAAVLEEAAEVYSCEFSRARRLSWTVSVFQEVFERHKSSGSPGPGNGYFDAVQLLLEQIEVLSISMGLQAKFTSDPYISFLENHFPGCPRLTRCHYPAVCYFIARRIKEQVCERETRIKKPDFWLVSIEPSKKLELAAWQLAGSCTQIFTILRQGSERSFIKCFQKLEEHWKAFMEELLAEPRHKSYCWCPSVNIHVTMRNIHASTQYQGARASVERLTKHFEHSQERITQSIRNFPHRLSDTYSDNRAYIIARNVFELSAYTLESFAPGYLRKVQILATPTLSEG